jgi:dihydroorotate dehydrogenase
MTDVMGLAFANPLGLAAGFDKHGELIAEMQAFGFGFVEVGTVTPRPEPGGNLGADTLAANVAKHRAAGGIRIVVGISVGKNLGTPRELAVEDYLTGVRRVWAHADFVTVNLSAPAARYLGEAAYARTLEGLLRRCKDEQAALTARFGRRVPLAVKVGLDPSSQEVPGIVRAIARHRFDALIAAIGPGDRGAEPGPEADAAVRRDAARSVRLLASHLDGAMPLISVGGIVSPEDAWERLEAGAALVQLYRGLVSEGPGLIQRITGFLARTVHERHHLEPGGWRRERAPKTAAEGPAERVP